ncbi:hypothetical protein [Deinococcus misasensis]|uniref:hypothetical protein n=1 Tax=Deinococcus misasensis TaxID=392413 RepID=UPI0005594881|nr:hypothetical protein [Deinococcus misasensis]
MTPLKSSALILTAFLLGSCAQTTPPAPPVQSTPQAISPSAQTVFQPVPMNQTTLLNPLSGLYDWFGEQKLLPLGTDARTVYRRWTWRELTLADGSLNTALLTERIQWAKNRKQKLGLRVQAVLDYGSGTQNCGLGVPEVYRSSLTTTYTVVEQGGTAKQWCVPNWNDAAFQQQYTAFYDALNAFLSQPEQAKYIAFLDIGTYGKWGEWHMYVPENAQVLNPQGQPVAPDAYKATLETRKRLVDLVTQRFPSIRKVMMTDDKEALMHALNQSPNIGWRRDALGWLHFMDGFRGTLSDGEWQTVLNRYKTAPTITEFGGSYRFGCNIQQCITTPSEALQVAFNDVVSTHVGLVSNGNLSDFNPLDTNQKSKVEKMHLYSGFRPAIKNLTADYTPPTSTSPARLTLNASWLNYGTAPAYRVPELRNPSLGFIEGWRITYQIRNGSNQILWTGISSLKPSTLMPSLQWSNGQIQSETPTLAVDQFSLSKPLSGCVYLYAGMPSVFPNTYSTAEKPLMLAQQNGLPDGFYLLGELKVANSGLPSPDVVTPCPL